ncbi:MAG: hypothetical protein ACYTEQ_30070, partial [Planctomycetota bacterium]
MTSKEYNQLKNGILAAYKMKDGKVVETGLIHSLPEGVEHADIAEEGFTRPDTGQFLSRAETAKLVGVEVGETLAQPREEPLKVEHGEAVKIALKQGKPVPAEVLAEYPELAKPAEGKEVAPAPIKELTKAIRRSKKLRPDYETEVSIERGKRAGKYKAAIAQLRKGGMPTEKAAMQAMRTLGGPLADVPTFEPPNLSEATWEALFSDIEDNPHTPLTYEKIHTREALSLVKRGIMPAPAQITSLEKQFGSKFISSLMRQLPTGDKIYNFMMGLINIPRTLMPGGEISGMFRQALGLGVADPKTYLKSWPKFLQSYASENTARAIEHEIKQDPFFEDSVTKWGIEYTEWGLRSGELLQREETFMGASALRLDEWFPLLRRSERAMSVPLNFMRFNAAKQLHEGLVASGVKGKDYRRQARKLGQIVNDLSGRSAIKRKSALGRLAPMLNAGLFSPRFQLSRIKTVTKALGATGSWDVTKMAAGALVRIAALNVAVNLLAKMAGGDKVKVETDPRATDFMRPKVGNTRFDGWAGFGKYIRLIARGMTGAKKTQAGRIRKASVLDEATMLLRSSSSPIASLITDWWTGRKFTGEKFGENIPKEVYERLAYLFVQDTIEAITHTSVPVGMAVLGATFVGVGAISYAERPYVKAQKLQDKLAIEKHGVKWEELGPRAQKRIRDKTPDMGRYEQRARYERFEAEYAGTEERAKK